MPELHIAQRVVRMGGGELHYREAGAGPPVVLLHGFGHSSTAWLRTIPRISRRHRTIALDLPDYRRDAPWVTSFDPPAFASIVTRCIESLEIGPVHLVGNSLGGLVAMLVALGRPGLVRTLVLADPVGFTAPPVPPLDEALLALMGFWLAIPHRPSALIRAGYATAFHDPSLVDDATLEEIIQDASTPAGIRMRSRTLHEIFHFSRKLEAFHAALAGLRAPTLVVWGKNDPVLPAKDAQIARRVLPGLRLELLERCGHLPHIELPAIFSSLVLDFLDTT